MSDIFSHDVVFVRWEIPTYNSILYENMMDPGPGQAEGDENMNLWKNQNPYVVDISRDGMGRRPWLILNLPLTGVDWDTRT